MGGEMTMIRTWLAWCARLEGRFWLWAARNSDRWAAAAERRVGRFLWLAPGWRMKARWFRWFADLDRRLAEWLERGGGGHGD